MIIYYNKDIFLIYFKYIYISIYMKVIKKTPTPKQKTSKKCCDTQKCCADIEWSLGYLIGETVSCFVNLCLRFVNNTNKGFESHSKPNKPNMVRRSSL
jgi:hypothetical protein